MADDRLVTLATLTYAKAQILQNVLNNEGISSALFNVNVIQPMASYGVKVRIHEKDLERASQILESGTWLSDAGENIDPESKTVLLPVDFSDYTLKTCKFAFDYAGNLYVVSGDGKIGFYGMPTNDNSITVPAKDQIVFGFDSVEELESAAKASVYPNPASDVATVTAGCPIERIAVYNAASGAEALNVAGNGQNEMTIDVAGLSKGVYIVRINNVHTLKLIKR